MVIIQNGFSCENEMNIFSRLFFKSDEDVFITVNLTYEDDTANAYTTIVFDGEVYFDETAVKCLWDDDELRRKVKICACTRSLCAAAGKIRNVSLPWGVMSGIRPAKVVRQLYEKGFDTQEVIKALKHIYAPIDKKIALAVEVAKNEEILVKNISKNSVSLYIGIPFCPTRCLYCSFVSTDIRVSGKYMDEFVSKLLLEIEKTASVMEKMGVYAENIYIGGGTPTTLCAEQITAVLNKLSECLDLSRIKEFTLEAGRPDTITREKLEAAKKGGVNRISINPQSMNSETLEKVGRTHTPDMVRKAFEEARRVGFETINTDLIAGLPGETPSMFSHSLEEVIKLAPENITVHSMCIKRAASLDYSLENLTRAAQMNEMLDYAQSRLKELGYAPYYMYRQKNISGNLENVGYSKPGHMSEYNINIMEEVQTIIAMGGGGSTKIIDGGRIERIFNFKDPAEYIRRFDEILKKKDEILRIVSHETF